MPERVLRLFRGLLHGRPSAATPPARKPRWEPPPRDGKLRLNLGCGDKILPGYVNVDAATSRKGQEPDVLGDLRALPFPPGHADEILAVHVIEHFYPWDRPGATRSCATAGATPPPR